MIIAGDETILVERVAYIRPARIKEFIGIDVGQDKVLEILNNLGFETSVEGDKIKAVSPTWRGDVEGEHDLIEEVVRMIGLDNIPAVSLPSEHFPKQVLSQLQTNVMTIKHELASRGMYETVTWSFADSNVAQYFRKGNKPIMVSNPITADLDEMRPSILPNLLMGAKNNIARGYSNLSLFEVGPEFVGSNPGEQKLVATGIRIGNTAKKHWTGTERAFDLFDIKADALAVIAAAKGPFENPQISQDAPEYYHPGRSGAFRLGKNVLAYFGELHPSITKKLGLKQRVVAFEVFVDSIPLPRANKDKSKKKLELSQLQSVDKDLAFIVDANVLTGDVVAAALRADKTDIKEVRVFDVYQGENVPEGKKSIALCATFQPRAKTYSDQDIENLMNKISMAVKQKCGGELRNM